MPRYVTFYRQIHQLSVEAANDDEAIAKLANRLFMKSPYDVTDESITDENGVTDEICEDQDMGASYVCGDEKQFEHLTGSVIVEDDDVDLTNMSKQETLEWARRTPRIVASLQLGRMAPDEKTAELIDEATGRVIMMVPLYGMEQSSS